MRSAKNAVYGTFVSGVLWLTILSETLQRVTRKVAAPGEWWPLAIVTVLFVLLFVLFLVAGFMTSNIGSKRPHVKENANKGVFK